MNARAEKSRGYEAVIGLEVHVQLLTDSKIFCGCSTAFGAAPNTHTCPVCLGLPGALPVLNRHAVHQALSFILAVGGTVNRHSVFARKNYFYPDLPKGYQISQYARPLGEGGQITIADRGIATTIHLVRVHLEDDAGKSFHPEQPGDPQDSMIDFNRCGVPLLEIVSRPEIDSPEQAGIFLATLRQLVQYLRICSGNMEEGALRCDANVSVRRRGRTDFGIRTEVKNMNSIRAVQRALACEIDRQTELLTTGGDIMQQTLLWDEHAQNVWPMREKEGAADYRYFPEPDLPELLIEEEWIRKIADSLPELPDQRCARLTQCCQLPVSDAAVLTRERELADYFEETVAIFPQGRKVANWMLTEMLAVVKDRGETISGFPVRPPQLAALLTEIDAGTISGRLAKEVFGLMCTTGQEPAEIIGKRGLRQLADREHIAEMIDRVLAAHPDEVAQYRTGKDKILRFLVGQAMAATQGKANPRLVNEILRAKLG